LLKEVTLFPQVLLNVKIDSRYAWQDDAGLQKKITEVSQQIEGKGRVLIRPSGTEPLLRVMIEANDADLAKKSAEAIAELIPRA